MNIPRSKVRNTGLEVTRIGLGSAFLLGLDKLNHRVTV